MMEIGNNCWANTTVVIITDQIPLGMLKLVGDSMGTNGIFAQSQGYLFIGYVRYKGKMLTFSGET